MFFLAEGMRVSLVSHTHTHTFVFLGRGDACELGVDLVVLRDLEYGGAILNDPGQQVWSS